jgi:hypothetical protein
MNNWADEIRAKNFERVLSLAYQVNNPAGFEKSITDDLSYTEDMHIEKTGKEVKEKLLAEATTITADKAAAVVKMQALVDEIGTLPGACMQDYLMRGFERQLGAVPRLYGYEQIYPKPATDGTEAIYDQPAPAVNIKAGVDKMRAYNNLAEEYVRRSVEAIKLKTMVDNMPDSKKIKLSAQLAAQLGF